MNSSKRKTYLQWIFFFYFFKGTNFPNFPKEFYIKAAADLNYRPTITIYCLILVRLGSTRTHLCYAVERVHYLLLNKDFVLGELKSQLVLSIATGLQHLPLGTRHQTTMHSLNRYQVITLHSALWQEHSRALPNAAIMMYGHGLSPKIQVQIYVLNKMNWDWRVAHWCSSDLRAEGWREEGRTIPGTYLMHREIMC